MMLSEEEANNIRAEINELTAEHRDLKWIVDHLSVTSLPQQDELLVPRLKKRKLMIKDKIYHLERMLTPDQPA